MCGSRLDAQMGIRMPKRIQYLDIVKTIAIFLVVFCHFVLLGPTVPANLFMVACWAGVPLFFMVNGTLLFTRPLHLERHVRKTAGVYLILAAWKLIYLLALSAVNGVEISEFRAGKIIMYLFCFQELDGIINGHLWFIEALLAVYIVFPLFRICFDHEKGRGILLFFSGFCILMINGIEDVQLILSKLYTSGRLTVPFSIEGLRTLNPFGIYANMLAFFLFGALLHTGRTWGGSYRKQRVLGALMAVAGLLGMWGVKFLTSGQAVWDGILLEQGYRHIPVVLLAVGIFLVCRDLKIKNAILARAVAFTASRTLGIYYVHWLAGWILVPYMAALFGGYNVWTNEIKTVALILPSLAVTWTVEKIPFVRRLVTG